MRVDVRAAKQAIARLGFPIARAVVRMVPSHALVLRFLHRVFVPYIQWRSFATIATTRDRIRMTVRFPDLIQKYVYLFGLWEPSITAFVKQRLRPGDLFVDVGANVGYHSLLAAKCVGPQGQVIAIEASPTIAARLEENIRLNGFTQIEVIRAAVADRRKSVQLFAADALNSGRSTTIPSFASSGGFHVEAEIEAFPLAELVPPERLRSARLIKIDVEGAEGDVFHALRELLPTFGDSTEWIFELTSDALEAGRGAADIIGMFVDAGYTLYRIDNGYSFESHLKPPDPVLRRVIVPPAEQIDVVATKREHGDVVHLRR